MRRILVPTLLALLLAPATADAATRWIVRGAGYGHGIGMSQYGTYGYVLHGRTYGAILRHYYRGTLLGEASLKRVRVLLQASRSSVRFRGASRLAGVRDLDPATTYGVRRSGDLLALRANGKTIGRYRTLRVYRSGSSVRLLGRAMNGLSNGRYRGSLDIIPGLDGGATVINRLRMDDYLRGVVGGEMPRVWPVEALKVQAVAARTYAIATRKQGQPFDLYPDTRSQMYLGVSAESPNTDQAIRETAGQVVTYDGEPIVTYYFSTSGGRTENIENSFIGVSPRPYLKSVRDPYDDSSPLHRWRKRFTPRQLGRRLSGYVAGRFRSIKVITRGVSPRVVRARVIGTRGRRIITGPTIRARLDLYDTWASFTRVTTSQARARPTVGQAIAGARPGLARVLTGSVAPAPRRLMLERRRDGRWVRVKRIRTGRHGAYRVRVPARGVYRVRFGDVAGPAVRVR